MKLRNRFQIFLLTILMFALLCGKLPVTAQTSTGNLFGTVSDNQGDPLPGVTVTLTSSSGPPMVFVSNAQGEFRFLGLSPGSYNVKAELEGFTTTDSPNVPINVGRNTEIDITLSPALEDAITVSSESPLLEAIRNANADADSDTIFLNFPRSGANYNSQTDSFSLNLTQAFPTITAPLVIYNGSNNPNVIFNGANLAANTVGFEVLAPNCYFSGFTVTGFQNGFNLRGRGTTINDCAIVGNRLDGVCIAASDTGIFNCLISRNGRNGIIIKDVTASAIKIQANHIGTDAAGRTTDPDKIPASGDETGNTGEGIRAENSSGAMIGGTSPGDGNVIGGNGDGMSLINCRDFTVQGNYLGTNFRGDKLGNRGAGFGLAGNSSNNKIGGDVGTAFNCIAFNELGIIAFSGTSQNLFLFNKIFDNNRLGIDLNADGVTANDTFGDSDAGANGSQNFPLLISAETTSADTIIRGTLNSAANSSYRIQYFLNSASDSSGQSEGEHPLGSRTVTTNGAGSADVSARIALPLPGGEFITALATNTLTNDTSEFSPPVLLTGFSAKPDVKITKSAPARANCKDSITYTLTVLNAGEAADASVNVIDDLPSCAQREVEVTTSQGTTITSFNDTVEVGFQPTTTVIAFLGVLAPGASATITIKITLTQSCGEMISNRAISDNKVSSMTVVTMIDCADLTGISVVGKNVFVSGSGFKKGDQIEINSQMQNTKFIDANTLNAKKGKKALLPCDPTNPTRMNIFKLMRPGDTASPIIDTAAFATCP